MQGPLKGYCVDSFGIATSIFGTETLSGDATEEQCLELCLQHKDASSCMFRGSDGACWKMKGGAVGSYEHADAICWIFKCNI